MTVTADTIYQELRELRSEMRDGFAGINGRLRCAENQAVENKTNIEHLQGEMKTLSIVDKSIALLSGAASAIAGILLGK